MLLSLAISNYRSFKDEAVLDLQRRSFNTLRPREGQTWLENTWRRAAIFGANASGKSNFLRPLGLLNQAVKHSLANEATTRSLFDPHLRHTTTPTSFELEYVSEDVRYRWTLVLDRDGIAEESLYANPSSHFRKVFRRERGEVSFGNNLGLSPAARENIAQFMRPWALTMSAWRTVKDPGVYASALNWWNTLLPLILSDESDQSLRHQWLVQLVQEDPKWLSALRSVVAVADVGIDDIDVAEHAPEAIHQIQFEISSDGKAEIKTLDPAEINEYLRYLLFVHGSGDSTFSLPEEQESKGTRTWLNLAIPALFALTVGGVLTVDEIDGSLHPMLVRELVSYFASEELNPLGAQLLFSTHDVTLLGKHPNPALERGEVWFVEKVNSSSELIALDEFSVRDAHNVEKRYLQGNYGAVPLVDPSQLQLTLDDLRSDYLKAVPNKTTE